MKNIHVLPTDKPSRLLRGLDGIRLFENEVSPNNQWCVNVNIHVTNDEEIKDGDKRINNYQRKPKGEEIPSKKIILTTDAELIKDGIQVINDEFLQWFVKNPSCEEVEVTTYHVKGDVSGKLHYKIIIPKEEHNKFLSCCKSLKECHCGKNKETLEEFIRKESKSGNESVGITKGAKWQQERMYSEEEVRKAIKLYSHVDNELSIGEILQQFKKK